MDVTEMLHKKMIETGYLLLDNESNASHRCILENQVQIMRGLRAILKGSFEPYDDEGENNGKGN